MKPLQVTSCAFLLCVASIGCGEGQKTTLHDDLTRDLESMVALLESKQYEEFVLNYASVLGNVGSDKRNELLKKNMDAWVGELERSNAMPLLQQLRDVKGRQPTIKSLSREYRAYFHDPQSGKPGVFFTRWKSEDTWRVSYTL